MRVTESYVCIYVLYEHVHTYVLSANQCTTCTYNVLNLRKMYCMYNMCMHVL